MAPSGAFYFGRQSRPLFGWLHLPAEGPHTGYGLVICNPLGYEAIGSHRTNRHLAQAAADRGIPTLRFDYDGTGDSAGSDVDPGRVDAWLESIQLAANALREYTGVAHVYLFGIRLGGCLALLAAQDMQDIGGVIAVNPVIEGRRYLRELRALAATAGRPPTAAGSDPGIGIQEAAGFITTTATRDALSAINLTQNSLHAAPPRTLLVERTDLASDDAFAGRLAQLHTDVVRLPFPGYADMLRDAHENIVPEEMIRHVLDWLVDAEPNTAASTMHATKQPPTRCNFTWSSEGKTAELVEWSTLVDVKRRVFAVVTEAPQANAPTLLLLNSGAVHHIGPNRLYVSIARHCALHGISVVRLDLPGLGNSPADSGTEENAAYPRAPHDVVAAAIEFARTQLRARDVHCAGICSGGYHSLKAAAAGLPLSSIVVINPLTFFWKPHLSLAPPAYRDTAEVMRYKTTGFQLKSWLKLLRGRVNLVELSRTLLRHTARGMQSIARDAARGLGLPVSDDLVAELRAIRKHGTRMHFVFSHSDPGHPMLLQQAGAEVQRLVDSRALTINFIEDADHTFTPYASQTTLKVRLTEILT